MAKSEIRWEEQDDNSNNTSCSEEPATAPTTKPKKKKGGGVRFAADVEDETKIKPLQRAPSGFAFESEASIDPMNFRNSNSALPIGDKLNTARSPRRGISTFESNSSWNMGSRNMSSLGSMKWDSSEMNAGFVATESTLLGSMTLEEESISADPEMQILQTERLSRDADMMHSSLSRNEDNLFGAVNANDVDSDDDNAADDENDGGQMGHDAVPSNAELQIISSSTSSNESLDPSPKTGSQRKDNPTLSLPHQDHTESSSGALHIFDSATLADE